MRILGIFHYALGIFLLMLFIPLALTGPKKVWEAVQARGNSFFTYLEP